MYKNNKKYSVIAALWLATAATATPISDYSFKSPAFNGNGYGTYVLTIENEQYTRQQSCLLYTSPSPRD